MNLRTRIGPAHPNYRAGKTIDGFGYVQLSSKAHGCDKGKREHRVVMEQILGRSLRSDEVVHHINGNKADNRPANLSVETRASHNRQHGKGQELKCTVCGSGKWYGPALLARFASTKTYRCRPCWYGRGRAI
jgi:hypothetical protein